MVLLMVVIVVMKVLPDVFLCTGANVATIDSYYCCFRTNDGFYCSGDCSCFMLVMVVKVIVIIMVLVVSVVVVVMVIEVLARVVMMVVIKFDGRL